MWVDINISKLVQETWDKFNRFKCTCVCVCVYSCQIYHGKYITSALPFPRINKRRYDGKIPILILTSATLTGVLESNPPIFIPPRLIRRFAQLLFLPRHPFHPHPPPAIPFRGLLPPRPTPRPLMTSYCDVVYDVTVVPQFRSSIRRTAGSPQGRRKRDASVVRSLQKRSALALCRVTTLCALTFPTVADSSVAAHASTPLFLLHAQVDVMCRRDARRRDKGPANPKADSRKYFVK